MADYGGKVDFFPSPIPRHKQSSTHIPNYKYLLLSLSIYFYPSMPYHKKGTPHQNYIQDAPHLANGRPRHFKIFICIFVYKVF